MNRAMGMVMASEKVPQGESARALTTTRASTASRMIMIANTATRAAAPPNGEKKDDHVLDGAGEDDPEDDPHRPRQVAHLGGQDGPDQRAGPGDGGEGVAETD